MANGTFVAFQDDHAVDVRSHVVDDDAVVLVRLRLSAGDAAELSNEFESSIEMSGLIPSGTRLS